MQRKVFHILLLLSSIVIVSGCSRDSKIARYVKTLNSSQLSAIYTNKPERFQKKLKGNKILPLPNDLNLISPYNSIVILEDTSVSDSDLKIFPFAKVKRYKHSLVIDNTLSGVDIKSFIKVYSKVLKLPAVIYTNDKSEFGSIGGSVRLLPRKCTGKPCVKNKRYQRQLFNISGMIMLGKTWAVYFNHADTSIFPREDEIINSFSICNIIRLSDGMVILPTFIFNSAMLDSLYNFLEQDTLVKIVYTNNYFVRRLLPQGRRMAWLPRKYYKGKENKRFDSQLRGVERRLAMDNAIVYYFYGVKDSTFVCFSKLREETETHKFYYFPQGVIISSSFADIPPIIDTLVEYCKSDSMLERIYTNRVYVLKSMLERCGIRNMNVTWEPRKCRLKDTLCIPEKNFKKRMYGYKLDIEGRRALWFQFKNLRDRTFPKDDFLKSYLSNSLDKETDVGILFSSPYRNSPMLKALKQKIIPTYYNPNFCIYSNKVYILRRLLDSSYVYRHLPVQYFLPSYERNERLELQLRNVKQDIIVNNSILVYFRDPTDSINPSEQYIWERFKYLKFYNFKDGFVIGAYLGD